MLKKITSFLIILSLITITNLIGLAQEKPEDLKNSKTNSQKDFYDFSARSKNLIEKDSFANVDENKVTAKTMQDDQTKQKKKFAGINQTTAIVIGAAIATAIIIVLVAKGSNENRSGTVYCADVRNPCP